MLTLQVFDENNQAVGYLDLYEDAPISLNKRFQSLSDVNSASGSFTQTFRVPATKTNREYFGAYFDVNSSGGFNAKRRRKCILGTSSMTIMEGTVQLVSCYIQSGQHHEYELTVFGETADLASRLKGVQLSDIDWSSADHIQNNTNVLAALSASGLGSYIRYAIVDRGYGWTEQLDLLQASPESLVVLLRIDYIVDRILDHAGFELSGSFFASGGEGQEVYSSFTKGGLTNEYADLVEYGARGAIDGTGSQTINITTFGGHEVLEFVTTPITAEAGLTADDVWDYGSNFDDSTHRYTAPFSANYVINLVVNVTTATNAGVGYIQAYNVTTSGVAAQSDVLVIIPGAEEVINITMVANVGASQEIEFRFVGYPAGADGALPNFTIDGDGIDRSYFTITQSNELSSGLTFEFARNAPEISALDYLRGLQSAFNLLFIPTENGFQIETAQTYLYSGDVLDWSEKVDYDKDFVIRPTADMQSAEYEFTFQESQDVIGAAFIESAGRTFGRYKIRDTENDFASGTTSIEPPFQAWIDYSNGDLVEWMNLYAPDGGTLSNLKPMLVYYAGHRAYGFGISFGTSTLNVASYPVYSNCDTVDGGADAKLLTFGPDTANFHVANNMPSRTLYFEYWDQYFKELYSEESRIVECDAYLTPADVVGLTWSDEIVLREGRFRVLEINGYDASAGAPARLKLLRRLGDPYIPCDYTVSSITAGVVLMEDESGTVGFGNESCCLQYGYYWSGSKCLVTPPSSGRGTGLVGSVFSATGLVSTLPGLLRKIKALSDKVAHIYGTSDGIVNINAESGTEIISADAVKEETDRKFATTSQLTSITDSANEIIDLRRILKTEDEDKLGVFSDITDETAPSLEVDNTAGTAVVRSGANTGITADQSAVPGTVTVSVQAYNGTGGSEAQVDAITVTGSSADPTRATVSIASGDFRVPSPTQFSSSVNFTAASTATFAGSTSGIDYNDLDNLPAAGTPLASADQTLTADRTIDGSGSHDLIVKNPTDFKVTNSANATIFSVVPGSPGTVQVNGNFSVDSAQVTGGSIKLEEANLLGSNYIELKAPISVTSNVTLTFPDGAGSSGQVLQSNGSGTLTWTDKLGDTNPLVKGALTIERITVGNTPKIYIKGEDNLAGVVLQAPEAISTDVTFTLPESDGTNGQVLQTDGSGNLSFATVSGGGGGGGSGYGGGSEIPFFQISGRAQWSTSNSGRRMTLGNVSYGPFNWYLHSQVVNGTAQTYSASDTVDTTTKTMANYYIYNAGGALPNESVKVRVRFAGRFSGMSGSTVGFSVWHCASMTSGSYSSSDTIRLIAKSADISPASSTLNVYTTDFVAATAYTGGRIMVFCEHRSGTLSSTAYCYGNWSVSLES